MKKIITSFLLSVLIATVAHAQSWTNVGSLRPATQHPALVANAWGIGNGHNKKNY